MIRLLKYLDITMDLPLILTTNRKFTFNIKWWVDVAFIINQDMKCQIGTLMSYGLGSVYNYSSKEKLNTKNSTEVELVVVNEKVPQLL